MTARALDKKALWREIDRDQRRKARARLAELRTQLKEARARRKQALFDAKERCRAERIAASERARGTRLRVLQELRDSLRAERLEARKSCRARVSAARSIRDDIGRQRAELIAERAYQRDLRRIEAANRERRRRAPRATGIERRAESDDDVRASIPSDLVLCSSA